MVGCGLRAARTRVFDLEGLNCHPTWAHLLILRVMVSLRAIILTAVDLARRVGADFRFRASEMAIELFADVRAHLHACSWTRIASSR